MPAPHDLTVAEIAALLAPANHPNPLSGEELDHLTAHLSHAEMEEVVERLGLTDLARQLPPVLVKVMQAAQRIIRDRPPAYDDEVDRMIRTFDAVDLGLRDPTPSPPASPHLTPARPSTPVATANPPSSASASAAPARPHYAVASPTKTGPAVSWFEAGALTQGVPGASVRGTGGRTRRRARGTSRKGRAYAVFFGGEVGVFEHWDDVQRSITGHGLAVHSAFPSVAAAEQALQYARQRGWTGDSSAPAAGPSTASLLDLSNPLNSDATAGLWYAVCRGVVPGVYRSYLECCLNTSGVSGNLCNSFTTREEAEKAFLQAQRAGWVRTIARVGPLV